MEKSCKRHTSGFVLDLFFFFLNCVAFISKGAGRWTFLIDTTLLPTGNVLTVIRETVSHVFMKMPQ